MSRWYISFNSFMTAEKNKRKLENCISDNRNLLFHVPRDIQVILRSYLAGKDTAPKPVLNSTAEAARTENIMKP